MITIQIEPVAGVPDPLPLEITLQQAALQTLERVAQPSADLSIVVTGDGQIHQLNDKYRGVNAPTDVLSFPMGETDLDTGNPYLGDVLISYPRAQAQAAAGGHAVLDEMTLLVVHGVLHLLGFDHANSEQKSAMWSLQTAILTSLGCMLQPPPE